jgi:glycerol-3-phosphate dehydrogenase subunit C
VVYYHGCATMYYEPFIGKAAVAVFEHNGYEVIVPEQNCCGLPLLSNGEFDAAAEYHHGNVNKLAGLCARRITHRGHQHKLHADAEGRSARTAGHHGPNEATGAQMATWDIFEWLRELHDAGALKTDFRPLNDGAALPRALPIPRPPRRQAGDGHHGLIPGLDLREATPAAAASPAPTATRRRSIRSRWTWAQSCSTSWQRRATRSRMTACDSETCRWQLEHGTDLPSRHPIECWPQPMGCMTWSAATPMRRLVTRAEVAAMAALLCTPGFAMLTGQTLVMDGGRSLPRMAEGG